MGGLASINYAIKYAEENKDKKVKIITVDTPYQPNNYAAAMWLSEYVNIDIPLPFGGKVTIHGKDVAEWTSKQKKGDAHRDLGGLSSALADLREKWNSSNNDRMTLHAIAVSMNGKDEESAINDMLGDGVVDVPAQHGRYCYNVGSNPPTLVEMKADAWKNIKTKSIVWGNQKKLLPLTAMDNDYHHCNTPAFQKVIDKIRDIIEQ
jgi:hypothetical protein